MTWSGRRWALRILVTVPSGFITGLASAAGPPDFPMPASYDLPAPRSDSGSGRLDLSLRAVPDMSEFAAIGVEEIVVHASRAPTQRDPHERLDVGYSPNSNDAFGTFTQVGPACCRSAYQTGVDGQAGR